MKKPFFRYEDVPLVLSEEGDLPVIVFANQASISASQSINAKKFTDDHNISFALQNEDLSFAEDEVRTFLMGPIGGPAIQLPESVEVIQSGQKIAYPNGAALYVNKDVYAGEYHIEVKSSGDIALDLMNDIPYGEIEVLRTYSANSEVKGRLNVTYYLNTGNLDTFADLTGLVDPKIYPQVNENKITGSLGDYKFYDAYLTELSFSAKPFEIIEANLSLDIYGKMEYSEGWGEEVINSSECLKAWQYTVPHAMNTKIYGSNGVGIDYPLSFDYSISARREAEVPVPLSGLISEDGELPTRVCKNEIDISVTIEGEKLDPFLKISGQRADVRIVLSDIGFDESFSDNNYNKLNEFRLNGSLFIPEAVPLQLQQHGIKNEDMLSVSEGGYLKGRATIKQSYR